MVKKRKNKAKRKKRKKPEVMDTVAELSPDELREIAKQKVIEALPHYEIISLPDINQYRIWDNHRGRDTGRKYKTRERAEKALQKLIISENRIIKED